ncbi:unnamed protein product, partial [Discosporangium mesarthrocarpum]
GAGPGPGAGAASYHESFRSSEGRLFLLGRGELRSARVQGWSQQVDSLVKAGEWLEALAVALEHFEAHVSAAPVALGQQQGAGHGARGAATATAKGATAGAGEALGPTGKRIWGMEYAGAHKGGGRVVAALWGGGGRGLRAGGGGAMGPGRIGAGGWVHGPPRSESLEHMSDLLTRYLRLAIENAPAPGAGAGVPSGVSGGGGGVIDLVHSHFQMLAGVCVEFCTVTGRLDLLFGTVYRSFRTQGQ